MKTLYMIYIAIAFFMMYAMPFIYSDYRNKEKIFLHKVYFYFDVLFLSVSFLVFIYPRLIGFWCFWTAIVLGIYTWRDDRESDEKIFSLDWINNSMSMYIICVFFLFFGIYSIIEFFKGDPMNYLFK